MRSKCDRSATPTRDVACVWPGVASLATRVGDDSGYGTDTTGVETNAGGDYGDNVATAHVPTMAMADRICDYEYDEHIATTLLLMVVLRRLHCNGKGAPSAAAALAVAGTAARVQCHAWQ